MSEQCEREFREAIEDALEVLQHYGYPVQSWTLEMVFDDGSRKEVRASRAQA